MSSCLEVAIESAREAGNLQISRLSQSHQIEYKGEIDLVTDVDRACEDLIAQKITGHFPDHDILAEEGGGGRKNSEYKWIIDPLDGTTNYAHGYPLFCVSIALEFKGEIIVGVVFDPNRNELFHAEKGKGSFLNGKKISVSQTAELNKTLAATGFAYNVKKAKRNNLNHFRHMIMAVQGIRRDGVAAIDLCYVACGRFDGFWELNLFPWDIAAGFLIVCEAGGKVTNFSGNPFSIYEKETLASNGLIHDAFSKILCNP